MMRQSPEFQHDRQSEPTAQGHSSVRIRLDGTRSTLIEPRDVQEAHGRRPSRPPVATALTDVVRASLWRIVAERLFAPSTAAAICLRRVWSSPALGAEADRLPDDAHDVIERWFLLVEPDDVYAFIQSVFDNLESADRSEFQSVVNTALDEGFSNHRFIGRKLVPIATKSDGATIERAFAACKAARWTASETHLSVALTHLAVKPLPERDGTIRHAVRAVELAAATLSGKTQALDDNLALLEAQGFIGRTMKNSYAGLFTYVTNGAHRATTEDARLVLVMCAGLLSHLATHVGLGSTPRIRC